MRDFLIRLRYLLTGDCGHGCCFERSYGCFVPEADCPVHDWTPFIEDEIASSGGEGLYRKDGDKSA